MLQKYEKYGEQYNSAINYNSKYLKLCNYGRHLNTRPILRESKTNIHNRIKGDLIHIEETPILALCGASIVQGLKRYSNVWQKMFAPLGAINLGIGGDRTQNLLWRVEDLRHLPSTVEFLVIHCGTNNLCDSLPSNIADGVLDVGAMARKNNSMVKILIMGLLHCDLNNYKMRSNVAEVNNILRRKCHKMNFTFAKEDADWLQDSELNMEYYHKDRIHLNKEGNVKFANTIIRKLKALTSSSSSPSSFSSDIIMRIPSSEVETHTNICHSPSPLPLNISSPTASSISCHSHVLSHIIDVPGPVCDYDHAKAMALMSSRPLCYVSFRQTCKRPQRKLRVALSSINCMSSSPPVSPSSSVSSPPSPCSSPSPCVPHTSLQYHWSFHISCLNFLMMVLSYLTLPFSLSLSYSQSKSYQAR